MKGPIVSIDVSKGKSDYQAFKEMNVKYTGSRSIKHTMVLRQEKGLIK